jgi:hypothetical protein
MSGAFSASGMFYQENYLLFRVLSGLAQNVILSHSKNAAISEFSIEGRTSGDSPVWDIWIRHVDDTLDFGAGCQTPTFRKRRPRALRCQTHPPSGSVGHALCVFEMTGSPGFARNERAMGEWI